jgi:glycosyltransferase involved in cell wall biosynthesis
VSRREGFFLEAVEQASGPVYHMDIRRRYGWHTWAELRRLTDFVRTESFDLVHAWDADAAIFGAVAARRAGVPLLTSRRDLGEIYAPRKLRAMMQADRQAAGVVVNADAIGARVRAQGVAAERIHVIPNILDVDEFDRLAARPLSLEHRLGPGRWIGHVARLDPEKDVATLLCAAARVVAEVPSARFALAGDGVERARLEALAAELHLGQHVVFLGDVTEVPALLRRMELAVLCPARQRRPFQFHSGVPGRGFARGGDGLRREPGTGARGNERACGGGGRLHRTGGAVDRIAARDGARPRPRAGRPRQVEQQHRPEAVSRQFADLYRSVLAG